MEGHRTGTPDKGDLNTVALKPNKQSGREAAGSGWSYAKQVIRGNGNQVYSQSLRTSGGRTRNWQRAEELQDQSITALSSYTVYMIRIKIKICFICIHFHCYHHLCTPFTEVKLSLQDILYLHLEKVLFCFRWHEWRRPDPFFPLMFLIPSVPLFHRHQYMTCYCRSLQAVAMR